MTRVARSSLVALLGMALAAAAGAQDGVAGTLRTIDGRSWSGAVSVQDGKVVVRGDAAASAPEGLELAAISAFEPAGATAAAVTTPHRLWLRSGLELPIVRVGGRAAADGKPALVAVETAGGIRFEVPLGNVRAIRHGGADRPEPALFRADLQKPSPNDDLVYVIKGDKAQRSSVAVTALTDTGVDFLLRGDLYDFELAGLCAIVFGANTGLAPDRQPMPRTRLELTSGEVLDGRLLELAAGGARLRLDEGVELMVPIAKLLRLGVTSDRLAWLSELTPNVEQTPAFDRIWPWTVDRSLAGPGFKIAGRTFQRGIGMVPRTRLTYDLGGRFDVFEAAIGIDDRGGPDAHALLRVFVDGKLAFESQPCTRGLPAQVLRVPLQKAKSLAIEADFGQNFDLGDHCVFADARVLQQ
ncbi:MAG: NPCBM/NEW2 domain-containing protein [Planctomycetes bacterium]|nr:NPCBM/NEW2 domain-containing protein [Planctomycetota bacterium]